MKFNVDIKCNHCRYRKTLNLEDITLDEDKFERLKEAMIDGVTPSESRVILKECKGIHQEYIYYCSSCKDYLVIKAPFAYASQKMPGNDSGKRRIIPYPEEGIILCPNCKGRVQHTDDIIRKRAKCPKCKASILRIDYSSSEG